MKLKYLNLNIWMGTLFEKTLAFLKEQKADIVVLQEVMHHESPKNLSTQHQTRTILEAELGLPYHAYMPLALDKRFSPPAVFGNLTLSRFPIASTKQVFFDRAFTEWDNTMDNENFPRGLLVADIKVGNKVITVANIHGIWGHHGNDTDRRLSMINIVLKELNNKERTILSGDFNLNENIYPPIKTPNLKETVFTLQAEDIAKIDYQSMGFNGRVNPKTKEKPDLSKPYRTKSVALLEEKLVNVFKDERITSFNPKHKDFPNTGYANAVVDMVFVSPNIEVLYHIQPDVDVSDHMPQIVGLKID